VILIGFSAFVAFACIIALTDWRRAWLLACIVGVLQDPARKLVPGQPVYITFAIIAVYAMILFGTQQRIQLALRDFARRFPKLWRSFGIVFLFLLIAAVNGVITFGFRFWKAPLLSLFVYLAPLPAILLGYMYVDSEERLRKFFAFYAALTSPLLVGVLLEYYRVNTPALGMVRQVGDYIRYLPGIQVRMLSGFYRAPDIMAWHAGTLASIGIAMIVRAELSRRAWPWMLVAGWGFYNCMLSGRRKAIYYVVVFAITFVWRYFRRLKGTDFAALVMAGIALAFVVHRVRGDENSRVYAMAAGTSSEEVGGRLEGGMIETVRQFGVMGAGLGVATQGVQHVIEQDTGMGWQEGGLGKLTVELGVPGLLASALLGIYLLHIGLKITSFPDRPWSSQIMRVTLFALLIANIANFLASAQTYSDPVITIITCFIAGSLFATTTLDERITVIELPEAVGNVATAPA